MRILFVGSVRRRLQQGPVRFAGHTIVPEDNWFSRVVDFDLEHPCRRPVVDEQALDEFVAGTRGYDAIFCETPEALLLAMEWQRRGMTPTPLLALDVHGLVRVLALREWFIIHRGFDPWPKLLRMKNIAWLAASTPQHRRLRAAGIPKSRLHTVRGCSWLAELFVPRGKALLARPHDFQPAPGPDFPRDVVLVPGSGRRDPACYREAARLSADLPFVVVDDFARQRQLLEAGTPANLSWLEPQPLEWYIVLLARARLVVVALLPGDGDGGHTTVALAHRLGTPVVCSRVPGIMDYVDENCAELVEPANPAQLAEAIRRLWSDADRRRSLARAGLRVERRRQAESRAAFLAALRQACGD